MNLAVRIIVRKIGVDFGLASYSNKLTLAVTNAPGFISSTSYWQHPSVKMYERNKECVVTISDWHSIHNWNSWLESERRNHIYNNHKRFILDEEFTVLCEDRSNTNIPLL